MEKTTNKIAVYFLTKEPEKVLKKIKETKSLKNFEKQKAEECYKEQKKYKYTKINNIVFEFYDNKFSNLLKDLKFLFKNINLQRTFLKKLTLRMKMNVKKK